MKPYRITVSTMALHWGNSNHRYMLGSLADIIGFTSGGSNFTLWLDNGNRLDVPPYHEILVVRTPINLLQ